MIQKEPKNLIKWWFWAKFLSVFEMVFTNSFQMTWILYSVMIFGFKPHFWNRVFELIWPTFQSIWYECCYFHNLIVITCWIRLCGLGYCSKRKISSLELIFDWIKGKWISKPCKTCGILYFLSLCALGSNENEVMNAITPLDWS